MPRKIKRKGSGSHKVGAGMLQQLQSLQEEMLKAQDEVVALVVSSTAGGGAVTATVTGERRVQSLAIAAEVVDPEDVEMLQDLIVAAVNGGLDQIDQAMTEKMQPFTGGVDIPGIG